MMITLPGPPTGPNARTHWAQLAKLKRQYRKGEGIGGFVRVEVHCNG